MRPRVLFLGGTRYRLPLDAGLERKWHAVGARLDYEVLAVAAGRDPGEACGRFHLLAPAGPPAFTRALLPLRLLWRARRLLRGGRFDAVVAESPHFGAIAIAARAAARARGTALVVEVHGDWRTATRLYGSPLRRVLGPPADMAARAALRRADAVRTVSETAAGWVRTLRGVGPEAIFPTFTDLSAFSSPRPTRFPEVPTVLFVGSLEPVKGLDVLARAWDLVAARTTEARLVTIGHGPQEELVRRLVAAHPGRVRWRHGLTPPEVARELDATTLLVLPSRSEGLPRVVIEAFGRGRPVVATAVGGLPELVTADTGLLVPPADADALADALEALLADPARARRLGEAARRRFEEVLDMSPQAYAEHYAALIRAARARPPSRRRG